MPNYKTYTCGRCNGSGHYSICEEYGTVCFGCGGDGRKISKAGWAASDAWDAAHTVKADTLVKGDRIFADFPFARGWANVTQVEVRKDGLRVTVPVSRNRGYTELLYNEDATVVVKRADEDEVMARLATNPVYLKGIVK